MRRGFAAGAAVPGIIRRRLQSGGRADAAFTAVDGGIEQLRQRRPDRLNLGPRGAGTLGPGFGGFAGFCGMVGFLRHGPEYGMSPLDMKEPRPRRSAPDHFRALDPDGIDSPAVGGNIHASASNLRSRPYLRKLP